MNNSTLFVFHKDPHFLKEVSRRLAVYGIEVQGAHGKEGLLTAINHRSTPKCLLLQVDLENYPFLKDHGVFGANSVFGSSPMIILTHDGSLYRLIARETSRSQRIFHANILLEHLIHEVLSLIPGLRTGFADQSFVAGAYGTFSEVSLAHLLDYLNQIAFSGRVAINAGERRGAISVEKGKIRSIDFQNLAPRAALKSLTASDNVSFRLEQRIIGIDEILAFSREISASDELSLNDIVIDLFYFMHSHFAAMIDDQAIAEAVEKALNAYAQIRTEGIYLVYDETTQEKLQIYGQVTAEDVNPIIAVFESIYNHLADQPASMTFLEFINTLEEIRPYLLQLQHFSKILTNGKVEIFPQ